MKNVPTSGLCLALIAVLSGVQEAAAADLDDLAGRYRGLVEVSGNPDGDRDFVRLEGNVVVRIRESGRVDIEGEVSARRNDDDGRRLNVEMEIEEGALVVRPGFPFWLGKGKSRPSAPIDISGKRDRVTLSANFVTHLADPIRRGQVTIRRNDDDFDLHYLVIDDEGHRFQIFIEGVRTGR